MTFVTGSTKVTSYPRPRESKVMERLGGRLKGDPFFQTSADDYYDFIPSDEEGIDEDEPQSVEQAQPMSDYSSSESSMTHLSNASASRSAKSQVLKPLSDMAHAISSNYTDNSVQYAPIESSPKLSSAALQAHTNRKIELEEALDSISITPNDHNAPMDAPFRYIGQQSALNVTSPAPTSGKVEGHGPEKHSRASFASHQTLPEEDVDPLYDDRQDDRNEQWVQSNLRSDQGKTTDAILCCPCCFLTVSMECKRHPKYSGQYTSPVGMNCRVKKDEVFTLDSGEQSSLSSRHYSTRQQDTANRHSTIMLDEDEYFGVTCSDCNTTVGIYDQHGEYHFFNVLPSNP